MPEGQEFRGISQGHSHSQVKLKINLKKLNCANCRRCIYEVIGTAEPKGRQLVILTVCPLLSPTSIPALIKTYKAIPIAVLTWKGGENSTTIVACPFCNLPVRQEGNLYVERARREEEAIQIPAMKQLASTFPTCCCWTVGAPHECLRCPRGLAPSLETQNACWKLLYPCSSVCFQHKIQTSRRWFSRWEFLHGQSLCSHTDSESQCLGASSQPWQSHSVREDFPCCFTMSPCQYSNKPGCNEWNKLSCLCL